MAVAYFNRKMKGYDPDEVDAFIVNLVSESEDKIRSLGEEARLLRIQIKELTSQLEAQKTSSEASLSEAADRLAAAEAKYEALCAQLGERLHIADERAAQIIREAEAQSEDVIKAARLKAEEESRRILAETRTRCASLEKAAEAFARRQQEITAGLERAKQSIEQGLGDIANTIKGDDDDDE